MIFFGLYFANVIGINLWPKEPVPPVTSIVEFRSILLPIISLTNLGDEFDRGGQIYSQLIKLKQSPMSRHKRIADEKFKLFRSLFHQL